MSDEATDKDLIRRQKAQQIAMAYQRVFATEDGKIVLEDLKKVCRFDREVFTPISKGDHSSYDPLTAALTDGARRLIVRINDMLAAPTQGDANLQPKTKVKKV